MKYAVVVSKFNEFITEKLLEGCLKTLKENKINLDNIDIYKVPGAFEIPTLAGKIINLKKHSVVICLGCVIRGETSHYDHICTAVSNELAKLGSESGLPVIFGIITCETVDQALDRAGGKVGNKGSEAAISAIEMVRVLKTL